MMFVRKKEISLLGLHQIGYRPAYPRRITWSDLEAKEKRLNEILEPITTVRVKVEGRYGYTAIDMYNVGEDGRRMMIDTLIAGLTKGQANDVLYAIIRLFEEIEKNKI